MIWGILGALPSEVTLLQQEMTVKKVEEALDTQFIFGTLRGQEVVVARCGIGTVNAAARTTWLLTHAHCDCVVNVGIAGGLAHGLKPMDVVISRELCFHDIDDEVMGNPLLQPDAGLLELCQKVCALPQVLTGSLHVGRIVTGDYFVRDDAMRQRILDAYAPDCVEMEGAAIAHVAQLCKKPFLVIRTMSDCADSDTEGTYDNFFELAANQSAHIIMAMLEKANEWPLHSGDML